MKYGSRHLKSDPCSLISVNRLDPTFGDDYSNAAYWKDKDDWWCYIYFCKRDGEREVRVDRDDTDEGWADGWWFAGVPIV
jgi:hypothetical protein